MYSNVQLPLCFMIYLQVDFEKSTYEFQLTEAHKAQIRAARIPIYLNLARCAMRQERYRDAISHAKNAVDESSGDSNCETCDPAEMDLVIKANWIAGMMTRSYSMYMESISLMISIIWYDFIICIHR